MKSSPVLRFLSFFLGITLLYTAVVHPIAYAAEPKEKAAPASTTKAPSAPSFSDQQITAFSKAQIAMHRIFMKYQPEMEKNNTDAQKKELQTNVISEMTAALKAEGLSQDDYNLITQTAGQDKALYERISKEMVNVQKIPTPVASPSPAASPSAAAPIAAKKK